jgi:hypothetical protein
MSKIGSYVCTYERVYRTPDLLGTRHPGLSGQDAYIGCFKEQVNSTSFCKIERGSRQEKDVLEMLGADLVVVVLKVL